MEVSVEQISKFTSYVAVSYSKHKQVHVILTNTDQTNHNDRGFEDQIKGYYGLLHNIIKLF